MDSRHSPLLSVAHEVENDGPRECLPPTTDLCDLLDHLATHVIPDLGSD
jgi:hypothetical protein